MAKYQPACGYKQKEEEEHKRTKHFTTFTHCFFPFVLEAYGTTWDF